jgi:hypothetical protein
MATDLSALLSSSADPSPEPDSPAAPERPDEPVPHTPEDGPEPEPGENLPAPPAEDEEGDRPVPVKAVREERRKRQEAERKNQEYERELAALKGHQDPREDPVRARLDLSVEYAQEQFDDYAAAESVFVEKVRHHPRGQEIYQAMLADKHPARFAYTIGKQLLALREIGDPTTYRERVLAEVRAKQPAPRASHSLPQTLATSRDTSGRYAARDTATPTPLSDLFAR